MTDNQREAAIDKKMDQLNARHAFYRCEATGENRPEVMSECQKLWAEIVILINGRSPEQVNKMQIQQNLV